ncbi:MAG: hypothetical protein SO071_07350 [Prevotella sp.]|nr:hypothetical protein [Prevotella sp.]MCI6806269.1 hypothetical protein [Prevotella sp.]MDY4990967.1 hypothetical protein [Prevotella sp.]
MIVVIANREFVLGISAYDLAGMWAILFLCLLSGAKVTKRFENTKIYGKKVVSFGKRRRDDGSGLLLQIVSFRAHLVTIFIGRREKWGAEVKA